MLLVPTRVLYTQSDDSLSKIFLHTQHFSWIGLEQMYARPVVDCSCCMMSMSASCKGHSINHDGRDVHTDGKDVHGDQARGFPLLVQEAHEAANQVRRQACVEDDS